MQYDFSQADPQLIYKLMASTITPRPIAWITTKSRAGIANAAPFSFFNMMGSNPPIIAIGLQAQADELKDTTRNILETAGFAINLVSFSQAIVMNETSRAYEMSIDELAENNILTTPASSMDLPLIQDAPVKMECILHTAIPTGENQYVILGEVKVFHIDDSAFTDVESGYIDASKLDLVSRMHGRGWYSRNKDLFEMLRPE